jgi:hypothetical protein
LGNIIDLDSQKNRLSAYAEGRFFVEQKIIPNDVTRELNLKQKKGCRNLTTNNLT